MDEIFCPACGGVRFKLLGQLGRLIHLRCEACGHDSAVAASEYPELVEL